MRCPIPALVVLAQLAAGSLVASSIHPSAVAARGAAHAQVTIDAFGRYALVARSPQGSALQVVDRMAGPTESDGRPGERDGRLDLFLDRGDYRLLVRSADNGSGTVALDLRGFTEKNAPKPPRLIPLKLVAETLGDFEQISWWLEVPTRQAVAIEAAGRHLADLRLWHEGTWLVDAQPEREVIQPQPKRPLLGCRLVAALEPGLYLVTAYGGPGQPWSEESPDKPLHLRMSIPTRSTAERSAHRLGPFGVDRWLVPSAATFVRLEIPEARAVSLGATSYDATAPFAADSEFAEIAKNSVPPVAELELEPSAGWRVVTVRGEAGQPYVLQHFEKSRSYPISETGAYWLATIHAGAAEDSVDATGLLIRNDFAARHTAPIADQVVAIDADTGWNKRLNLLDPLTLFFRVERDMTVEVTGRGVAAKYRVEPFLLSRPKDYQSPPFSDSPSRWELTAGYHVLTIEPEKRGILDVALVPTRPDGTTSTLHFAKNPPALQWPRIELAYDHHTLYLNEQPGVAAGVVLRRLPIDLADALPIVVAPSETIPVPVQIPSEGRVEATTLDGERLLLAVDDGSDWHQSTMTWQASLMVKSTDRMILVRNPGTQTASASLAFVPQALLASTPLPEMPDTTLAGLGQFPRLVAQAPMALDFARREQRTFLIDADDPGLYRLESTGLLATAGNLRARVDPSLERRSQNGSGRNFLIQSYLRQGLYQMTLATEGDSTGHLGLRLTKAPITDGGAIELGRVARAALDPDQVLAYRFDVAARGRHRVRAIGLGATFRGRLEDADGWPLVTPGVADWTLDLEPGVYRLVILPEAMPTRVVTRVDALPEPTPLAGHGPHRLPLGATVEHEWIESAEGSERQPDVWQLDVPAPATVHLAFGGDMEGRLLAAAGEIARRVPASVGFHGRLDAGHYRLEATATRRNSRLPYSLHFAIEELVVGSAREVAAPAELPLAIGENQLIEIATFGDSDVRLRLRAADGRIVGSSDDRRDDWNARLLERLEPGRYTVELEGNAEGVKTWLSVQAPRERLEAALTLPGSSELAADEPVHVIPLQVPGSGELLLVSVHAAEWMDVAVESGSAKNAWRSIAQAAGASCQLALPRVAGLNYRLRLTPSDRRGGTIRISATVATPPRFDENALAAGVDLRLVPDLDPPLAIAAIDLASTGLFELSGEGLLWSSAADRPLLPALGPVAALSRRAYLAGPLGRAKGSRLRLRAGDELRFDLPAAATVAVDVDVDATGPAAALARSPGTAVGVRFASSGESRDARTLALGDHLSVTATASAAGRRLLLWPTSGDARAQEVALELRAFAAPQALELAGGRVEAEVPRGETRHLTTPAGRLSWSASTGGLATILVGGEVREVLHADRRPAATITAAGDELLLFGFSTTRHAVTVRDLPPPSGGSGRPFEEAVGVAGEQRLAWNSTSRDGAIEAGGGIEAITWLGADGTIRSDARRLDRLTGNGVVALTATAGPLWVTGPTVEDRWGGAPLDDVRLAELPAAIPLSGPATLIRLQMPAAGLLQLVCPTPVVLDLLGRGASERAQVHPDGARLALWVPAGRLEIAVRGFAGRQLTGTLTLEALSTSTIAEGIGPETLVPAGAAHAFTFDVERSGRIGIGIRSDSDDVQGRLLAADGRPIAEGLLAYPQVEAGGYVLVVSTPPSARAALLRPILAGVRPPPTDPPEAIVKRYLELSSHPERIGERVDPAPRPPEVVSEAPAGDASNIDAESSSEAGNDSVEGGEEEYSEDVENAEDEEEGE